MSHRESELTFRCGRSTFRLIARVTVLSACTNPGESDTDHTDSASNPCSSWLRFCFIDSLCNLSAVFLWFGTKVMHRWREDMQACWAPPSFTLEPDCLSGRPLGELWDPWVLKQVGWWGCRADNALCSSYRVMTPQPAPCRGKYQVLGDYSSAVVFPLRFSDLVFWFYTLYPWTLIINTTAQHSIQKSVLLRMD